MPLDESAKLSNIYGSVKKYFVDRLVTIEGISLDFDKTYTDAYASLLDLVNQWVIIALEPDDMETLSSLRLSIYLYSRRDAEGDDLAALRDTVMAYLRDRTQTDGFARVELFNTADPANWISIGGGVLLVDNESGVYRAKDETKFMYISVTLRWGTKI